MSITTGEIRNNGNWIKNNLKTRDGIIMLLILLLIGVIIFLYVENSDLKGRIELHQKIIDNLNEKHADDLRIERRECKQELLDWKNIVDVMSNQSQQKADLSRKVIDLTKEKIN